MKNFLLSFLAAREKKYYRMTSVADDGTLIMNFYTM